MEAARDFDEMVIRRVDEGLRVEYRRQGEIAAIVTYPALLDLGERVTIANVTGTLHDTVHLLP